ncbi:major head protein [Pectobacterium phage Ymer]|uniref:Major head protein n=2 Tax=unclassified Caudoviricetes TaxID=2788787 RepID=A0AB39AC48_9CAUD|nr:hypothetical protein Abuela_13 [Pectobacterium phage Abuela]WCD42772.1 major capsid protein [Pectobacterium phage Ymer]
MAYVVFDNKLVQTTTQLVHEILQVFNQNSNGCVLLTNDAILKDYTETVSLGLIDNLVTDRNAYAAPGTKVDVKVLAQLLTNSVNLSAKVGPVTLPDAITKKIGTDMDAAAAAIAAQAAQAILIRYINSGFGAAAAAIGSNSAMIYTQPENDIKPYGSKFPTLEDFALAKIPLGDQQAMLRLWGMSGAQWLTFQAREAIKSAKLVFELENMRIFGDGLGSNFLVSDAVGSAIGADTLIGLTPEAVIMKQSGLDMRVRDNGTEEENFRRTWKGEFDYSVAVKGYKLKDTVIAAAKAVPRSFTTADITNTANWEKDKGSVGIAHVDNTGAAQAAPVRANKETAGVLIKLTATAAEDTGG